MRHIENGVNLRVTCTNYGDSKRVRYITVEGCKHPFDDEEYVNWVNNVLVDVCDIVNPDRYWADVTIEAIWVIEGRVYTEVLR